MGVQACSASCRIRLRETQTGLSPLSLPLARIGGGRAYPGPRLCACLPSTGLCAIPRGTVSAMALLEAPAKSGLSHSGGSQHRQSQEFGCFRGCDLLRQRHGFSLGVASELKACCHLDAAFQPPTTPFVGVESWFREVFVTISIGRSESKL